MIPPSVARALPVDMIVQPWAGHPCCGAGKMPVLREGPPQELGCQAGDFLVAFREIGQAGWVLAASDRSRSRRPSRTP